MVTSITHYAALYYATAVVVNITFNLEIPLRILCQYVLFRSLQPIHGSLYDLIGGIIITLAVTLPSAYDFAVYLKDTVFEKEQSKDEGESLLSQ